MLGWIYKIRMCSASQWFWAEMKDCFRRYLWPNVLQTSLSRQCHIHTVDYKLAQHSTTLWIISENKYTEDINTIQCVCIFRKFQPSGEIDKTWSAVWRGSFLMGHSDTPELSDIVRSGQGQRAKGKFRAKARAEGKNCNVCVVCGIPYMNLYF